MAAGNEGILIRQGEVAEVSGQMVGVAWAAADGSAAQIVVAGKAGGRSWELQCDVRPGEMVPIGGSVAEVMPMASGAGVNGAGAGGAGAVPSVRLVPRGAGGGLEGTVFLPAGGRLRLDGPSVMEATDLRALSWEPDERQPVAVMAEWLPATFPREATAPGSIVRQRLVRGSSATVGRLPITVAAVEGAGAHHPAWLVLRLQGP